MTRIIDAPAGERIAIHSPNDGHHRRPFLPLQVAADALAAEQHRAAWEKAEGEAGMLEAEAMRAAAAAAAALEEMGPLRNAVGIGRSASASRCVSPTLPPDAHTGTGSLSFPVLIIPSAGVYPHQPMHGLKIAQSPDSLPVPVSVGIHDAVYCT
jgi:hypothetical protein